MIKRILSVIIGACIVMSCAGMPSNYDNDAWDESGVYMLPHDPSTIYISGNFSNDTQMPMLFALRDKSIKHYTIVLNTNGGDAYSCTAIMSAILRLKAEGVKFTTIADTKAFSAGFFIWMLGDERLMRPGSTLMIHTMIGQKASQGNNIDASHGLMIRTLDENVVEQTYRALPNVSRIWLETALLYTGMTWVDGEQAMELKLATGLVD